MNKAAGHQETSRILVVDDDLTVRLLARETLEREGFIVEEAADGKQAADAFERAMPDLILLDVMMPGIDGFAVCQKVRSHPDGKNTAILMMTGLDDVGSIRRSYEAGATDFITKPINWVILGYRAHYMIKAGQAAQNLSKSEALLSSAQRIARLGSWDWDIANDAFNCSQAFYGIFNIDPAIFGGTYQSFINLIHPLDKEHVKLAFHDAMTSKKPFAIDHKIMLADGAERFVNTEAEPVLDKNGNPLRMNGTVQDITERKQAEEHIRILALYDSLTGLPNRVLFKDRLKQALKQAARYEHMLSVMFIDLDRFKDVNDSLGHKLGDILLQQVAQRLLSAVRGFDTVARLGGDEFTICLQNLESTDNLYSMAQRIMDLFSTPFLLEGRELFISASIGISMYPTDGQTEDALIKQADIAMYNAKEQGKNNYKMFSTEMQVKADARLALQNEMRRALERNEFVLHYQPIFSTEKNELAGIEALVRWQNPEKGMIPPNNFIPMAESTGIIVQLGEWVLLEACRQNMKWQEMGYAGVKISVNISPVQFKRDDILATIRRVLESTGMDPRLLEIEITESMLMQDCVPTKETADNKEMPAATEAYRSKDKSAPLVDILCEIQKMGISIALDDFGTGYSSLSYLSYLPVNILKIDRSFVQAIKPQEGNAIIPAIIAMSRELGLNVIAEGVETKFQRQYLSTQGCHELQGYLLGRPATAEEFVRYFQRPDAA